jgi:tellurite resistance protein TerC
MHITTLTWVITLLILLALLTLDLAIIGRRPHEPSMKESAIWVGVYVGLAILFGLFVWWEWGGQYGGEFFAGWLTEYSLSIDNLFVFVIIMARFAVPRIYQQKVLLIGIVLALVMRGAFIAAGAAVLNRFIWVFYLFGIFLIYTATKLFSHGSDDAADFKENPLIRWSRRVLPISKEYDGANMTTHAPDGRGVAKRMFTPMLIVMIAIGTTDLVFALDSIPAIFGLTKEPYIVFTANVLALMGLRQLYFLLGGLLDRLVYLSVGLAFVLGFIGIKLILEALHENNVPFINGGNPVHWAPHIPIWLSLTIILGTLVIAAVASVMKSSRTPERV